MTSYSYISITFSILNFICENIIGYNMAWHAWYLGNHIKEYKTETSQEHVHKNIMTY